MEKLSVSKEFVLAAHKEACRDWKDRIELEFPELFKMKFKDGDWVTNMQWLHKIGYNHHGEKTNLEQFNLEHYNNPGQYYNISRYRLATKEEIESHLIKLAEKKGFKEGVSCFWSDVGLTHKKLKGSPKYNDSIECLSFNGHVVYQDGKWAEVIAEPKTYTFTRNAGETTIEVSVKSVSEETARKELMYALGVCSSTQYTLKSTN